MCARGRETYDVQGVTQGMVWERAVKYYNDKR